MTTSPNTNLGGRNKVGTCEVCNELFEKRSYNHYACSPKCSRIRDNERAKYYLRKSKLNKKPLMSGEEYGRLLRKELGPIKVPSDNWPPGLDEEIEERYRRVIYEFRPKFRPIGEGEKSEYPRAEDEARPERLP
jgi:hypothetical protein